MELPSKISFGPVDKMTVGILRIIHRKLLPVKYSMDVYQKICEGLDSKGELAYFNDDIAIGEICYRIEKDQNNSKIYLMTIGVLPTYQKLGIATKLINHIIEKYPNTEEIYLHVSVENFGALEFYQKIGFEKIELAEKYYKSLLNPDAFIYRKKLK